MSENQYQYEDNEHKENHENEMNEEIIYNQDSHKPISHSDLAPTKSKEGHDIISEDENKIYFLKFKSLGNNLKILLSEQDTFPAKTYEIYLALEELKLKNELFSNYASTKQLSEELNRHDNKINFIIKKKQGNLMGLTIVFPTEDENIDNDIEIDLIENIIDNREMFRQLFEKYKSIQEEQNEDISQFLNRIKNIEEILVSQGGKHDKENYENQGEPENEQKSVNMQGEEKIEEHKEIQPEVADVKSSNKESMSSIHKGKNVKKGKLDKKKEDKGKNIKKKKK